MSAARGGASRAAGVALGGFLLTLAALLFDAAPLFVPAVAFLLLAAAMPTWVYLAARGASIERELPSRRVLEDEPLEARIEVSRGALGLPAAELIDPLAATPVALGRSLSTFGGRHAARIRVQARFPRRGRIQVDPPSLVVHDGLELARALRESPAPPVQVVVLPRTERVRWTGQDLAGGLDTSAGGSLAEPLAAAELDGLRPYRAGTPASRIHWPALARGAGLLERRMHADGETRPLVVLDARGSAGSELVDAAVRAAASLTLELGRVCGAGLLLPGERRAIEVEPDLSGWPAAHTRLALIEGGPHAPAPSFAHGSRVGPVFYVAAQTMRRVPASLGRIAQGLAVLVLPDTLAPVGATSASFEVSGCRGFVLGTGGRARPRERAA